MTTYLGATVRCSVLAALALAALCVLAKYAVPMVHRDPLATLLQFLMFGSVAAAAMLNSIGIISACLAVHEENARLMAAYGFCANLGELLFLIFALGR